MNYIYVYNGSAIEQRQSAMIYQLPWCILQFHGWFTNYQNQKSYGLQNDKSANEQSPDLFPAHTLKKKWFACKTGIKQPTASQKTAANSELYFPLVYLKSNNFRNIWGTRIF